MGAGGSKTLARGFAMAPHRLRALVDLFEGGNFTQVLLYIYSTTLDTKLLTSIILKFQQMHLTV